MPAAQGSLFDHTIHFSAGWVRASIEHGVHAVGSVSAYICGRQTFLGRPINNPHAAGEIAFSGLSLPSNVEFNAETLWVRMDACERKADGSYRRYGGQMPRVASHIDAALPWGLSEAQARHIVEGFARWLTSTYGVGVQYGCHNQDEPYDHAHFLMSTRSLDAERAGKKVREMNGIAMQHMDRAEGRAITHERDDGSVKSVSSFMDGLRAEWARRIGEERGSTPDHRSFARRGLNIEPVPYVRRGTVEYDKRQARRAGEAVPDWRRDRATRLAERSTKRLVPKRKSMAAHGRAETATAETAMATRIATLRLKQLRAAIGRGEREMRHGWFESEAVSDAGRQELTRMRIKAQVEKRIAGASASVPSVLHDLFDDWHSRLTPVLGSFERDRREKIARQEQEAHTLSRRQRLVAMHLERLVAADVIRGLRQLAMIGRRFVDDWAAIAQRHKREWTELIERQRQSWPPVMMKRPDLLDSARPIEIAVGSIASSKTPKKPISRTDENGASPARGGFANSTPGAIAIIEEIADRLLIVRKNTSMTTALLSGALGESPAAFDRRTDERVKAMVSRLQELGPGSQHGGTPRPLAEIAQDLRVSSSERLERLVASIREEAQPRKPRVTPTGIALPGRDGRGRR